MSLNSVWDDINACHGGLSLWRDAAVVVVVDSVSVYFLQFP